MRIPVLLTSFVFVAAIGAPAQDLHYRMVMSTHMPALSTELPAREMRAWIQGSKIRFEMQMPVMSIMEPSKGDDMFIMIVDHGSGKVVTIDSSERTYTEKDVLIPGLSEIDSAALREAQATYGMKETGETAKLFGYDTRRVVMMIDMPPVPSSVPSMKLGAEERMIMVNEAWMTNDSVLVRAFDAYTKALASSPLIGGQASDVATTPKVEGFPIRTTMIMARVPKSKNVTAEDVIAGKDSDIAIIMRTVMEARDFKIGPVDSALFAVPKGFVKSEQ